MTLHQDIIRARLDGATNLQDAYRIAWMAGIPRQHRKAASDWPHLHRGTKTLQARANQRAAEIVDQVMPLHNAGKAVPEIRAALGLTDYAVRKAIRDSGAEPNRQVAEWSTAKDLSVIFPEVAALRAKGMGWAQIAKRLNVPRERTRREYKAKFGADA